MANPNVDELETSQALLYAVDGTVTLLENEKFNGEQLRELLECETYQWVPFTVGQYVYKRELWCDEEGMYRHKLNPVATRLFGEQTYGGKLYGPVLVKHVTKDEDEDDESSGSDEE